MLDGGAMFGVVPKSIWQKTNPADSNNMVKIAARCLLVEEGDRLVLIDTGMGNKQSEKFFSYYHRWGEENLESSIKKCGFSADDVTDFFLTHREGNGAIVADKHYALSYSPKGQTDKNFVSNNISFTANTAQTINHNLNKFPSVTTVDSGGSHVVGDIQHIDTNSFTITFTASFTGKVYVN